MRNSELCLEAWVERLPDGSVICPLLESGAGSCEECMEIWEVRWERFGE